MQDFLILTPALVALVVISLTRQAALGLGTAVVVASFMLSGFKPTEVLLCIFKDHLFPSIMGSSWNVSAILFTLTLGAFAATIEASGGFRALLDRFIYQRKGDPKKRLLYGVYGLGLVCFFDGLANSVLVGRVSRPLIDRLKISREMLAYVIDSTSSSVACIAFISTWIATQLALISEGIKGAALDVAPTELFFASIPANAYCLITLILVPIVIARKWEPGSMKRAVAIERKVTQESPQPNEASIKSALIPIAVLIISIPSFIYLWQEGETRTWRNAFTSSSVPYAMVFAGFAALATAYICYPRSRKKQVPKHMQEGAGSLLPALLILVLAWTLGSQMKELGVAEKLSSLLGNSLTAYQLPLAVFLLGSAMSFVTGTAWGTMGLLMPLAIPLCLELGTELPLFELKDVLSLSIGAVFGGAVFGDHCSPFSDTTIVSAMASGCTPMAHVSTQLPYALTAAAATILAYAMMAQGLPSWLATTAALVILVGMIFVRTRHTS